MEHYDVVVVGAGPAGGQCARRLSASGKHVLLIEKAKTFDINNYSSGGSNLKVMADYDLPESIVAAYWNKFAVHMTQENHQWIAEKPVGVVLDFKKLRHFLAEETSKTGGNVKLGVSYHSHENNIVHLKNHHTRNIEIVKTNYLVDATGSERKVLMQNNYDKRRAMCTTGIEFLLEVHPEDYSQFANTLTSFLGTKWMPQGYAWIFPMESNRLKVGVIRYFQHENIVPHDQSYLRYLEQLMNAKLMHPYEIIDKHGKTLYYTYSRKDEHYRDNIIAIGDAISTLNPLAAEGIRHALYSGHQAAEAIISQSFGHYQRTMNRYCGLKWAFCEKVMNIVYKSRNEKNFDLYLNTLRSFNFDELIELLFDYKTRRFIEFGGRLGLNWLKSRYLRRRSSS